MLTAFTRAFKTPDLRRKLLFTLAIVIVFRLGCARADPGCELHGRCRQCIKNADQSSGVLGLANLFSGGALLQLSIFALGIMPYITASIIVQLLTVVIPRFEALKKEGQQGQTKMTQYTRYLTIGLAILQSSTLITFAQNPRRCSAPVHEHPAERLDPDPGDHGAHDDRRHRRGHVARRAGHRQGHRQRHVAADLHLDRRALPRARCGRSSSRTAAGTSSSASSCSASSSSRSSSSSSRASAASRCSTPSGRSVARCTAAPRPTSRSRSTWPASSP